MLRISGLSAITIREIDYAIRIRDKDSSFSDIIDILKDELTAFRSNSRSDRQKNQNTIHDFIQTNIERSIVLRENTRVYFLNYREREGSLRIEFTLLIVTSYINYASLRQELDSHIKESLAGYFEELLERHIPVNVTVQSNDTEIVTLSNAEPPKRKSFSAKPELLTRLLSIAALVISLGLAGLFAFKTFYPAHQTENSKLKEDYIDALLEKKILEAVKDQKFTINLYKIADTAGTTPQTIPKPAK